MTRILDEFLGSFNNDVRKNYQILSLPPLVFIPPYKVHLILVPTSLLAYTALDAPKLNSPEGVESGQVEFPSRMHARMHDNSCLKKTPLKKIKNVSNLRLFHHNLLILFLIQDLLHYLQLVISRCLWAIQIKLISTRS